MEVIFVYNYNPIFQALYKQNSLTDIVTNRSYKNTLLIFSLLFMKFVVAFQVTQNHSWLYFLLHVLSLDYKNNCLPSSPQGNISDLFYKVLKRIQQNEKAIILYPTSCFLENRCRYEPSSRKQKKFTPHLNIPSGKPQSKIITLEINHLLLLGAWTFPSLLNAKKSRVIFINTLSALVGIQFDEDVQQPLQDSVRNKMFQNKRKFASRNFLLYFIVFYIQPL